MNKIHDDYAVLCAAMQALSDAGEARGLVRAVYLLLNQKMKLPT